MQLKERTQNINNVAKWRNAK